MLEKPPSDPADDAEDRYCCYAEELDYHAAPTTLDLGIPDHIEAAGPKWLEVSISSTATALTWFTGSGKPYSWMCHFWKTRQIARNFDVASGCISLAVGASLSRQRLRISSIYIFLNRL